MGRTSRRRKRAALREQHDRRHDGGARSHVPSVDGGHPAGESVGGSSGPTEPPGQRREEPPRYTEAQVRGLLLQYARWATANDEARRFVDRQLRDLAVAMATPSAWAVVTSAVDAWLHQLVGAAHRGGWTSADLVHAVRQTVSARAGRLLASIPPAPGAARVEAPAEAPVDTPAGAPPRVFDAWQRRGGLDARTALSDATRVIGLLGRLGRLPATSARPAVSQVDEALLTKVRALLAKAEATSFLAEAEAFTAKAQQLMTRHSIDAAMVAAARTADGAGGAAAGATGPTAVRRVHLDDPYAMQKAELLHVVAEANEARSVVHAEVRIATLVGHPTDLDLVELLFTSLLLQASQQMAEAGRAEAADRTTTFRRSFLTAYTVRIRERLAEARRVAEAEGADRHGAALVPALRARVDAVEHAVTELFPHTRRVSPTASIDRRGWVAGRSAADRADMGAGRRPLAG